MKKIILRGIKREELPVVEAIATGPLPLQLKSSYLLSSSRSIGELHEVEFEKDDLLEFIFDDGTAWMGGTAALYDIYPESAARKRSVGDTFELPLHLSTNSTQRGWIGDVALKILNVFSPQAVTVKVKEIAANLEKKLLQGQSGLYKISAGFQLEKATIKTGIAPNLLFIHGTNSSTVGSFAELLESATWKGMQQQYGQNIFGLQHETMTKSPLHNVLELMMELPDQADLHLVTHSRGGLVGDALCRFCNGNIGFTDEEIAYLQKTGRTADIQHIRQLQQLIVKKKITVSKYVRVACPAAGTTILSKRLDHFLNISFNLIGLLGPLGTLVAIECKTLIAGAVQTKNDPNELPGLEAMNPDSAFLKVLNNPGTSINSPLTVISGNSGMRFNVKALLIIASKLFYLRDNDLVVDTRSMYGGSRRINATRFFFDEGPDVDHVHYFKNKLTQDALLLALQTAGNNIPGFTELVQSNESTLERNALLGLDGGGVYQDSVTGKRPILILLPGIMGSNLKKAGNVVWINYFRFLVGELSRLDINAQEVTASSLIKTSYKKIVGHFNDAYDVVTFSFDWRLPLEEAAALLNERIEKYLTYDQPIKIVGHSMGGVVSRDFILQHPQTWKKLNASPGFKMILLGAPLGGSYRIPYVLAGKDPIINKLSKVDLKHTKKELLDIFRQYPGLLGLLPMAETPVDFSSLPVWQKMKSSSLFDWNVPEQADLDFFKQYRGKVNEGMKAIDFSNIIYVAGKDAETICGYEINPDLPDEQLVFLSTTEGDQSVTWDSGIPTQLLGTDRLYYTNVTHGALANEPDIFNGIAELLSLGRTNLLSKVRPATRAEKIVFRTTEPDSFDVDAESLEATLLGLPETKAKPELPAKLPVKVSISHGDLLYSSYPLLVGHFKNDGILSAEAVINRYMEGALAERHRLGMYPGAVGTNEILKGKENDFKGTIIVGLGEPGALTAYQLVQTIEQGIMRYMLEMKNDTIAIAGPAKETGISTLLIGAGYGGLSVESSMRAIIQGVENANAKIGAMGLDKLKPIDIIEFVELYEDRCLQSLYTLTRFVNEESSSVNIRLPQQKIRKLFGSRLRLPLETSSDWWKRISVTVIEDEQPGSREPFRSLRFSSSTGSAREEQRDLFTTPAIIDQLVQEMSTDNRWSAAQAKTVFELLVPNDFKEAVKKQSNTLWILDKTTAAYPWELLQDTSNGGKPLCYNAGMIRQLYTQDYRVNINLVGNNKALIIGDPNLEDYPGAGQLPGAVKEANLVERLLGEQGFDTANKCINKKAPAIIQALFRDDYKIMHLAGHGIFNPDPALPSGMLIGNNVFLSTREICQMSTVPELVFVNCCFLGKMDNASEKHYRDRFRLAANLGTQLIENGVRIVIAAGWAVDDEAALHFTEQFYSRMLSGSNFGQAIQSARQSTYNNYPGTNTWGAYQCYGDPFYMLRQPSRQSTAKAYHYLMPQEALIDLDNLLNKTDVRGYTIASLAEELDAISKAVEGQGIVHAGVYEKQAMAYAECNQYDKAIGKFEQLLGMEQASFSVYALERYCNARIKVAVNECKTASNKEKQIALVDQVIDDLQLLLKLSPTAERYSLIGKAWKNRMLISATQAEKVNALEQAAHNFYQAAHMESNNYKAYALTNWLQIEYILVELKKRKWGTVTTAGYKLPALRTVRELLMSLLLKPVESSGNMDFWETIDRLNASLCLWLLPGKQPAGIEEATLLENYARVWNLAGSQNKKMTQQAHFDFLSALFALPGNKEKVLKLFSDISGQLREALRT
jgi:CHAT domain-containing protein